MEPLETKLLPVLRKITGLSVDQLEITHVYWPAEIDGYFIRYKIPFMEPELITFATGQLIQHHLDNPNG